MTTPSPSLLPCLTCQASRAFLAFHLRTTTNRKSLDSSPRFATPPRSPSSSTTTVFYTLLLFRTRATTLSQHDHITRFRQQRQQQQRRRHRKIPAAHSHTAQVSCWNTSLLTSLLQTNVEYLAEIGEVAPRHLVGISAVLAAYIDDESGLFNQTLYVLPFQISLVRW